MTRKLLLLSGVVTAVLYVAMNAFVPLLWPGFSSFSQTISELSAIDAPTRTLWLALGALYGVLLMAFGYGVWLCGRRSRPLRIAGALIIADGVFCLFWPPMHQRTVLAAGGATLTDTLHIAWTMVSGVLMMLSIGFAAAAFGRRFRAFAVATIVLLVAFGAVTGTYTASVQANLPTPWLGIWERIDAGLLMLWLIVLAVALLRRGDMTAGGIVEEGYRRLGGVDQWVMIRGEDLSNPPLICLHGGPGLSETWLLRYFNAVLEKSFTVVYWDQRGAGKSFHPGLAKSMNVEQFIADLDQLVDIVRARLGRSKVVIFGHSWGSALGVLYAARFPEKVSAYVGAAQIGDCAASESASYAFTVAEAQRLDNQKALKALRALGPPPYPAASSVFTERIWSQRLDGQLRPAELWKIARVAIGGPESVLLNLRRTIRGFRFTMNAMWPEVSILNLPKLVPTLRMPVFFFLGKRDHWVPAETSVAYFDALTAPEKTLVWFERSGHEMFADEPDKFNHTMVELVRPAAREPLRAAA